MVQFVVILICTLLCPGTALAEKRLALLIANQAYAREIGALKNPHKDINVVGAALSKVGFERASQIKDANRDQIVRAIYDYADELGASGPAAVGFFYYSGHGIAAGGDNFIIPINAKNVSRRDLDVSGVKVSEILAILNERAPRAAHFVVFDACRNNLGGIRGAKGFVPILENAGMLIAFSTAPGAAASDHGEESGPYASALAAEILVPGRSHVDTFFEVRARVAESSGQEQIPWIQDGLLRRVYFTKNSPQPAPLTPPVGLADTNPSKVLSTRPARRIFQDPTTNGFPIASSSPGLESGKRVADTFCKQQGYENTLAYVLRPTDGRQRPVVKLGSGELCGDASCLTLTRIDCVGGEYMTTYSQPQEGATRERATFVDPTVDGFRVYFSSPGLQNNKGVADAFCQANGFKAAIAYLSQFTDGRQIPAIRLHGAQLCADNSCLTLTRIDCGS